eukprot:gene49543-41358_t
MRARTLTLFAACAAVGGVSQKERTLRRMARALDDREVGSSPLRAATSCELSGEKDYEGDAAAGDKAGKGDQKYKQHHLTKGASVRRTGKGHTVHDGGSAGSVDGAAAQDDEGKEKGDRSLRLTAAAPHHPQRRAGGPLSPHVTADSPLSGSLVLTGSHAWRMLTSLPEAEAVLGVTSNGKVLLARVGCPRPTFADNAVTLIDVTKMGYSGAWHAVVCAGAVWVTFNHGVLRCPNCT